MSGAAGGAVHTIILRDAWGKQVHKTGTPSTAYLYTGQRWDELLGLYDYNARWYDPDTGRFVSADTVVPDEGDPQAWNRLAYVLNRPLTLTDPSGHSPKMEDGSDPADVPVQQPPSGASNTQGATHSAAQASNNSTQPSAENRSSQGAASATPQVRKDRRGPRPDAIIGDNGQQIPVPTDLPNPNDQNLDEQMATRGYSRRNPNENFRDGKGNRLNPDTRGGIHDDHWDWTNSGAKQRHADKGWRLYPDGTAEPQYQPRPEDLVFIVREENYFTSQQFLSDWFDNAIKLVGWTASGVAGYRAAMIVSRAGGGGGSVWAPKQY